MKKISDLTKMFPEHGNFLPISEEYAVSGWGIAQTDKGAVQTLHLVRIIDHLEFSVFVDQLRQDEQGRLCISKPQLDKQVLRAVEWRNKNAPAQ